MSSQWPKKIDYDLYREGENGEPNQWDIAFREGFNSCWDKCRAAADAEIRELREALEDLWHITGSEADWEFQKEYPKCYHPNYAEALERCRQLFNKQMGTKEKERPND